MSILTVKCILDNGGKPKENAEFLLLINHMMLYTKKDFFQVDLARLSYLRFIDTIRVSEAIRSSIRESFFIWYSLGNCHETKIRNNYVSQLLSNPWLFLQGKYLSKPDDVSFQKNSGDFFKENSS
jgi:hypothetical protein